MSDKKKEKLNDCQCGEPWVTVFEIRPGLWIACCRSCPCHVYGESEDDVRAKWNQEVAHGSSRKRN